MPVPIPVEVLPSAADLPLPAYATAGAAGMDLVAAIDAAVDLPPGRRAAIPCGIRIAVPEGYEAQVRARSGLALKHGLVVPNGPGTIDADYRGELAVILANFGEVSVRIERGMRIAQLVVAPVARVEWARVETLPPTARGAGGFGHTGTTSRPSSATSGP